MRIEAFRHHVLALCMVSPEFAATASALLQPRFFEVPAEQHMCRFMLEYYRQYQKPPKRMSLHAKAHEYFDKAKNMLDVAEEFDVLLDVVCDLETDAAEQSDYILDKVVSFCQEESLKEALLASVGDIQDGKFAEVLPRITKAMMVGAELDGSGIFVLKDADTRKSVQQARRCVSTGQVWIDEPTKGGVAKREMLIIMAPPNVGKSTALINIGAGAVKKGHKVAHFTLEMSQDLTRAKYDQCLLNMSDDQFEALDETGRNKIARFMQQMARNCGGDIYIKEFPAHKLTTEMLRAHLMLLKAKHDFEPDMLIIDYMDLMAMPSHIKDEVKQLTWTGVEIRAIGGATNTAVCTASQTNRGGSAKETAMGEDIAGDFMKMATCDIMISINQTAKEAEEDLARATYIKNRIGKKYSTYKLVTDFDRSSLQLA